MGRAMGAVARVVFVCVCVCVCVLKGGRAGAFTPPDKAGHYSQMVVCSLRPCVWCVCVCVCVCVYGQRQIQRTRE